MNSPVPVVFIITVLVALLAGAVSQSDQGIVTVYSAPELGGTWHDETAPVQRRIALILDEAGRSELLAENPSLRTALERTNVDFDRETLLVASMGAMPTGGYGIRVTSVQAIPEQRGGFRVSVRLSVFDPEPDAMVTQAFTYPVDVAVIPREKWPAAVWEALQQGDLPIEVLDQDGRVWGPAFIYRGGLNLVPDSP